MKRYFCFIFLFIAFNCGAISDDKNIAWIAERFAEHIINDKKILGEDLFPIVGFQKVNGVLFIQTYGGELTKVVSRKTKNGTLIDNFKYTINLQKWPERLIKKYNNVKVYYYFDKDKIHVLIRGNGVLKKYSYTSNIRDSRFQSILEIKGWLLEHLIPTFK